MQTTVPSVLNIGIDGMSCGHCVARVTQALNKLPGLQVKNVAVGSATVVVSDGEGVKSALAAIQEVGYAARALPSATASGGG